jgi:hypothetical protein
MTVRRRILLGLWVGLVLGAAAGLFAFAGLPHPSRELFFWLVACAVGEVLWVRLPLGSATISMASCFNFAALLVLPLPEALTATMLATFAAELTVMRKPFVRALFNAAQTGLAVAAGYWCFHALAGKDRPLIDLVSHIQLLPFLAAAPAYYLVNRGAVAVVVAIAEKLTLAESWRRNFGSAYDVLSTGAAFSLGILLATHYASIGMVGTLFVLLPLILACDGYRRFTRDAKHESEEDDSKRHAA